MKKSETDAPKVVPYAMGEGLDYGGVHYEVHSIYPCVARFGAGMAVCVTHKKGYFGKKDFAAHLRTGGEHRVAWICTKDGAEVISELLKDLKVDCEEKPAA